MPSPDQARALAAAIEDAASALSRVAADLHRAVEAATGASPALEVAPDPGVAEPVVESPPEPDEDRPSWDRPPREGDETNRFGEVVNLARCATVARDLDEFTRSEFVEALRLKPIAASKWIRQLSDRTMITPATDPEKGNIYKWSGSTIPDDDEPQAEATAPKEDDEAEAEELSERQKQIVQVVADEGPATAKKIRTLLDIEDGIGNDLYELQESGRIKRHSKREDRTGQVQFVTGKRKKNGEAVVTRRVTPVPGDLEEPTSDAVRDFVTAQKEPFGPAAVHRAVEGDLSVMMAHLETMEQRGIIEDVSPMDDLKLWEYRKPDGPGKAAERDAELRAKGLPVGVGGGGGAAPVAGTGRQTFPNDSEAKKLVQEIRSLGYDCEPAGTGHWAVTGKGIKRVLISGTPRNQRSVLNDRTRVKRAGIPIT